jgi:hypothetical protein
MTHFPDLAAGGAFEARWRDSPFGVFGKWDIARTRAASVCMNVDMAINLVA